MLYLLTLKCHLSIITHPLLYTFSERRASTMFTLQSTSFGSIRAKLHRTHVTLCQLQLPRNFLRALSVHMCICQVRRKESNTINTALLRPWWLHHNTVRGADGARVVRHILKSGRSVSGRSKMHLTHNNVIEYNFN